MALPRRPAALPPLSAALFLLLGVGARAVVVVSPGAPPAADERAGSPGGEAGTGPSASAVPSSGGRALARTGQLLASNHSHDKMDVVSWQQAQVARWRNQQLSSLEKGIMQESFQLGLQLVLQDVHAPTTLKSTLMGNADSLFAKVLQRGYVWPPSEPHQQQRIWGWYAFSFALVPLLLLLREAATRGQKPRGLAGAVEGLAGAAASEEEEGPAAAAGSVEAEEGQRGLQQREEAAAAAAARQQPGRCAPGTRIHLLGLRFFFATWVYVGHTVCNGKVFSFSCISIEDCSQQVFHSTTFSRMVARGFVSTNFFMMLAGFQMASSISQDGLPFGRVWLGFYKSKFARILPGYLLALLVFFILGLPCLNIVLPVNLHYPSAGEYLWNMFKALLMVQTWSIWSIHQPQQPATSAELQQDLFFSPNLPFELERDWGAISAGFTAGPLWFMSSLAFSLLLAPAFLQALRFLRSRCGSLGLGIACLIAFTVSLVPAAVAYGKFGIHLRAVPVFFAVQWTPWGNAAQFAFGMCIAELLRDEEASGVPKSTVKTYALAALGDLCFLSMFLICAFVPTHSLPMSGGEVFFIAGMGPLFAAVLYCSCHPMCGHGILHRAFGNAIGERLGKLSFHLYLLHLPIVQVVKGLTDGLPTMYYPDVPFVQIGHNYVMVLLISALALESERICRQRARLLLERRVTEGS